MLAPSSSSPHAVVARRGGRHQGTLNNGLEAQLLEQKAELKSVKDDFQLIRDALIGPRPARLADARRLPGHAGSGGVWRQVSSTHSEASASWDGDDPSRGHWTD